VFQKIAIKTSRVAQQSNIGYIGNWTINPPRQSKVFPKSPKPKEGSANEDLINPETEEPGEKSDGQTDKRCVEKTHSCEKTSAFRWDKTIRS
jgi:hypothetical protein